MNEPCSERDWEDDLVNLLEELSGVQEELLAILARKRHCMAVGDTLGMLDLVPAEQSLSDRLQRCHVRRATLLDTAQQYGLPGDSLTDLASTLARRGGADLRGDLRESTARMRLLQHHSLTNWVLAQKALLHVAQMLEIIATGGRLQPTYGSESSHSARGSLVDQEV